MVHDVGSDLWQHIVSCPGFALFLILGWSTQDEQEQHINTKYEWSVAHFLSFRCSRAVLWLNLLGLSYPLFFLDRETDDVTVRMAFPKHVGVVAEKNLWVAFNCQKFLAFNDKSNNHKSLVWSAGIFRLTPAFNLIPPLPRYAGRICGDRMSTLHIYLFYLGKVLENLIVVRTVPTRVCHFTRSPASEG
jgi:hypothetical protein